jgi:hypothetical protein
MAQQYGGGYRQGGYGQNPYDQRNPYDDRGDNGYGEQNGGYGGAGGRYGNRKLVSPVLSIRPEKPFRGIFEWHSAVASLTCNLFYRIRRGTDTHDEQWRTTGWLP